jgi:hypothetical protein
MKILSLLLGGSLLVSCSSSTDTLLAPQVVPTQNQQLATNSARVEWLHDLKPSSDITTFHVEIQSLDGKQFTSLREVQPNSNYLLVIKGDKAVSYTLKTTSGFTASLQSQSLHHLKPSQEFSIPIHTDADLTTPLFVSIVPLHTQGESFTKEKPKSFLLLAD